ncbi:Mu transposase C-terminal domain-containing protein [Streptomyces sp. NPDC055287]
MLVPEPMRPGWSQTLAMSDPILPHQRLMAVDARLEKAAAKPIIVPDTIVIDHGKVFVSYTFSSACSLQGTSLQLARPMTPTDQAIVERTFASINSLFCQYVAGYTGSDVTRRGSDPASEAVWTLAQLQDFLDEWIICWQQRPYEGLRNPCMAGRTLSPNESYAIAVARAGYLPVALSAEDYIELLPAVWRAVNDYGIKVNYRTYDSPDLNRLRRQPSGVTGKQDLWEIHYDPCDVFRVWVRRSDSRRWIEVPWTHLPMVRAPFADFTWRHARQLLADQGRDDTSETAIAQVLAKLLRRSGKPPAGSEQVMARTRAALEAPARKGANGRGLTGRIPMLRHGLWNPHGNRGVL